MKEGATPQEVVSKGLKNLFTVVLLLYVHIAELYPCVLAFQRVHTVDNEVKSN